MMNNENFVEVGGILQSGGDPVEKRLRLRDLREDNDLTQKQLAKVLGTTSQYYQKYESGLRPIPVCRLEILADYYHTSTDYILGRTNVRRPYPKK